MRTEIADPGPWSPGAGGLGRPLTSPSHQPALRSERDHCSTSDIYTRGLSPQCELREGLPTGFPAWVIVLRPKLTSDTWG